MRVSTGFAPTSSSVDMVPVAPSPSSVLYVSATSMADEYSTGDQSCRTQCSGSVRSFAVARAPVTVLASGTLFADNSTDCTTARNSSAMGFMRGEWKACDTLSFCPSIFRCSSTAATPLPSPDTTTDFGPFTAATDTDSSRPSVAIADTTDSSSQRVAHISPTFRGSDCMRRPRSVASCMPASMVMTPATQPATISPTLWPSTRDGTTPRASQSCARDHSRAKIAGWVYMVRFKRESAASLGVAGYMTSSRDSPV